LTGRADRGSSDGNAAQDSSQEQNGAVIEKQLHNLLEYGQEKTAAELESVGFIK
jgi:hypothetical protein